MPKIQTSRRLFLHTLGFGVITTGLFNYMSFSKKAKKPNILFLFADDQRFDTIHALGNNIIKTPNLDSLVQNGMSFSNAYFMGAKTAPVCAPSRAQLLSGLNLFHLQGKGAVISKEQTFPELLRSAGYETYITGKWHNDRQSLISSFEKGGKILFFGKPKPGHFSFEVADFTSTGQFIKYRYTEKHSSELLADEVTQYLKKRDQSRPFFAYVPLSAPHYPWESPPEYQKMYNPDKIPLPPNFKKRHPFDNGELGLNGLTGETKIINVPRQPHEVKQIIADYYAIITHMDAQIGRIFETLKKTGEFDNTLIVFGGDNGMATGQHGLVSKQNVYEHSVHVPLVFSGLDVPKNQRSDALCYLFDIYPTLCDFAGVSYPESIDGKSLYPCIFRSAENREALVIVYKNFQRALRYKQWKLILYNVKGIKTTQLFDLEKDPWENNNLAGHPDYTKKVKELKDIMQTAINKMGGSVELDQPDWGVEEIPALPDENEYWKK